MVGVGLAVAGAWLRNGCRVKVHVAAESASCPSILPSDVEKFNAQYPALAVRFSEKFHDRFLILDDEELYLIGASLKDLGRKCFAFTKLDATEIAGLKARV